MAPKYTIKYVLGKSFKTSVQFILLSIYVQSSELQNINMSDKAISQTKYIKILMHIKYYRVMWVQFLNLP